MTVACLGPDAPAAEATAPVWSLGPDVLFLNHGSFGATPAAVLCAQQRWRAQLEREPVAFFLRTYQPALDAARARLAAFVGAAAEDLVFVTNATTAVATVFANVRLAPGDEVLALDHGYPACVRAAEVTCARAGAIVRRVTLPMPLATAEDAFAAVVAACGPRTRICLLDAITSPSAVVLPFARIVAALRERGVETLLDAAHAPGMVPLELDAIGAAWTTGNLHKWVCAPKGAAFLHVRSDRQRGFDPLVVSHGYDGPLPDRPRLWQAFDWTGTFDPSAWLAVPAALDAVAATDADWPSRMAWTRARALELRDDLLGLPGAVPTAPAEAVGAMAAVLLPAATRRAIEARLPTSAVANIHPLQEWLFQHARVEIPVIPQPQGDGLIVRASAQRHLPADAGPRLVDALLRACAAAGVA